MKKLHVIEPKKAPIPIRKKVAAYCRISMETERMNHSLSAQISYYNNYIQKNPDWQFAGVYSDDGISGTRIDRRNGFQQMIQDAESGKIDIILTKSIQRFARNTVDLLETVRHLKELGIEVRFEKENINSLSGDGELMLSILASLAQEESRSISDNVKWRIKKKFEQGEPLGEFHIYGYHWVDGQLVPEPEEAKIVQRIFREYLSGSSRTEIMKRLNEECVPTKYGYKWGDHTVKSVLSNIHYTGNLLLQKEFCEDPITKVRKKNHGELPQYFVENTHESLISMEDFEAAQEKKQKIAEAGIYGNKALNLTCLSAKMKCGRCGKTYVRSSRINRNKSGDHKFAYWVCDSSKKGKGSKSCGNCMLHETYLKKALASLQGNEELDEERFSQEVDFILVKDEKWLDVHYKDGTQQSVQVISTARQDCWSQKRRTQWGEYQKSIWTDEMRVERGELARKVRNDPINKANQKKRLKEWWTDERKQELSDRMKGNHYRRDYYAKKRQNDSGDPEQI